MGLTPEKGFGISVVRNIRQIACQSRKNSSPGQRLYSALVQGIQYFERNSSAHKEEEIVPCATLFLITLIKTVSIFPTLYV